MIDSPATYLSALVDINIGTILIVDDVLDNLILLEDILASEGYIVIQATNGKTAIELAKKHLPDLILLDIVMPGMDGYEVCNVLKMTPDTTEIPVIFISALDTIKDITRAFSAGGVDYVTKPFHASEVLARVQTHLRLVFQYRQLQSLREHDMRHHEMLNQMKEQFVNAAVHDLKNPLHMLMGFSELIESELKEKGLLEDEQTQLFVDGVKRAHKRMITLITDILDLAQIDTGIQLHREPTPMKPFLEKIVETFSGVAGQEDLDLVLTEVPADLFLSIDRTYMGRALENLIMNAIKFTEEGGKITINAKVEDRMAHISVEDTGPGIPDDVLPHLFDAFYKGKFPTAEKKSGNGLGLSIVKAVAEQHNGRVTAATRAGEGSTFTLEIPL